MQQGSGRKLALQPFEQRSGKLPFFLRYSGEVPLRSIRMIHRNKRRLATHGQPHVLGKQPRIHIASQLHDRFPLGFAVWKRDTGRFVNAGDRHGVFHV